ncbi:ribosomal protein S6 kinase-like 1 [Homalodisca vitripennis]|nr:ribosomal protein S6 kinase-like 1 [Homalodisca vitripennis]
MAALPPLLIAPRPNGDYFMDDPPTATLYDSTSINPSFSSINKICCHRDLNPDNVLVCGSTVRLTYFCSFPGVEPQLSSQACSQLYTAPELSTIFPPTAAADWWSLGTLLYQLLTGQVLVAIAAATVYHSQQLVNIATKSHFIK